MQNTIIAQQINLAKLVKETKYIYEYTTDKNYLEQYYKLREDCYKENWGLKIFSGKEDAHDRRGHILIVRDHKKVIGGGRVAFRYSDKIKELLPMETQHFLLHELLSEIGTDRKVIGEIGRIAILPTYRGGNLTILGLYLLAQAQFYSCQYLTTVAPLNQALKYIKIAEKIGITIQMIEKVPVAEHPYYNEIEMKLLICDISMLPDYRLLLEK